jgi:hypothetical protein
VCMSGLDLEIQPWSYILWYFVINSVIVWYYHCCISDPRNGFQIFPRTTAAKRVNKHHTSQDPCLIPSNYRVSRKPFTTIDNRQKRDVRNQFLRLGLRGPDTTYCQLKQTSRISSYHCVEGSVCLILTCPSLIKTKSFWRQRWWLLLI